MRFTSEQGWIEITFDHYATDAEAWSSGLYDEKNSVELGFDFSLEEIGWGCVGFEYVLTTDIKAIEKGARDILNSFTDEFSYSVSFPYPVLLDDKEFCVFRFSRNDEDIKVDLRIWDGLCEYIKITQVLNKDAFSAVAEELIQAALKFPVR